MPTVRATLRVATGVIALSTSTWVPIAPVCASSPLDPPPLIPREVFFGNPERAGVQISPDGTHLSYLADRAGVLNVWIQRIGDAPTSARPVTMSLVRPIRSYFWAWNSEQILYLQDDGGDENFHLYAATPEAGIEVDLTPYENVQTRIIALDRDRPDEILVALNDRAPQLHDVYRMNTRTGARELVYENNEGFVNMQADGEMRIRLGTRFRRDGGIQVATRDADLGEWYEFIRWNMEDTAMSAVLGLTDDGSTIYVRDSRGHDTAQVYAYTAGPDGPTYEKIAGDPRTDAGATVVDPATGRIQAVAFEYTRREWTVLDPSIRGDMEYLSKVADGEMSVVSRDRDDDTWVIAYERDDGPLAYYLYERPARSATYLFSNRPALDGLPLAKMKPVVIRARDGLELVSYLTLPVGVEPAQLPMVLLVHGGPWARDTWGYNGLHQWLANRGYAVLSVNFRGSTGFGKRFLNASIGEWAGRMQDDLIDASLWAVDEGIAHPDRIAIMGGSYGGYAALVGVTFTPDFFAAGVDIVGPSHVRTLLDSIPPYWEPVRALFESRIGNTDDPAFLDAISPLTRVEAITRPLLIGQGRNDPRVKEAESRQIVEAMQRSGLPVTYVVFPDEGHGFARNANSQAFFAVTEGFLAQHLGGRAEPIGSAVRESSALIQAGGDLIPGLR